MENTKNEILRNSIFFFQEILISINEVMYERMGLSEDILITTSKTRKLILNTFELRVILFEMGRPYDFSHILKPT